MGSIDGVKARYTHSSIPLRKKGETACDWNGGTKRGPRQWKYTRGCVNNRRYFPGMIAGLRNIRMEINRIQV